MKILIVSTSDINGGAARAAYRLHQALLNLNIDSHMLVQDKKSDDFTVYSGEGKIHKGFAILRPTLDGLPTLFYKHKTKTIFSPAWVPFGGISKKINEIKPDLVHLHGICGGMMRVEEIAKINAPIVWNLHDMWAFTGGCRYDEECGAYRDSCGQCKVLGSDIKNDLSQKVFRRKEKSYTMIPSLSIVCSSQWMGQCVKESTLLKNRRIDILVNCIDTQLFRPIKKSIVKDIFHIPQSKKVILFGAMNSLDDPRKGAKELFGALENLNVENTVFVIAGRSKPEKEIRLKYPVYYIPPLFDEVSLPLMYNVADVVIVPSLQENLANSIVESLSCGVPVVSFDIGGNKDLITHQVNGYLAKAFDPKDMAVGIEWILNNKDYKVISQSARETVTDNIDSLVVAKQYISLYKDVLN